MKLNGYFSEIGTDRVLLSLIVLLGLYALYTIVIRVHVGKYVRKHRSKPVHYKTFRMYSESLITNAPSKKEKHFYRVTNKITLVFNVLLVAAFAVFLLLCFR